MCKKSASFQKKISLFEKGEKLSRAHCKDVEYKANVLTRLKVRSMGMKSSVIDGNDFWRDLRWSFGDLNLESFYFLKWRNFKLEFYETKYLNMHLVQASVKWGLKSAEMAKAFCKFDLKILKSSRWKIYLKLFISKMKY